ncbi:MAG: hypothetical protein AAGD28_07310 [Bacteroidota bacterium]
MNIWEIYHKSFDRELNSEELDFLDTMIRKYPYFAMARYLKAKAVPSTSNIGLASAHASNRPLFKAFMEGKKSIREKIKTETMEESPEKTVSIHQKHELFSIVDTTADDKTHGVHIPFAVMGTDFGANFQGFLDSLIKEKTQKHIWLAEKIRTEIIRKDFKHEESPASGTEAEDLIQRFLNKNPKIRRPNPEKNYQKTEDFASMSVSLDEEIASETLAKLHLQQNNTREAIRIYKKLRLLFPEKSAYFDAQILEINKK